MSDIIVRDAEGNIVTQAAFNALISQNQTWRELYQSARDEVIRLRALERDGKEADDE